MTEGEKGMYGSMRKRVGRFRILCALWLALCVMLVASAGAETVSFTWNEVNGEAYGATVGARVFRQKLQELSGGTMDIDLYVNGVLGFEAVSMQSLQMGTLDIFRGNASSLPDYGADLIGATGMPFLFKDIQEFERMAESPLGQELLDSVEAADCGFVAIGWMVEVPRNLFLTDEAYERLGRPDRLRLEMLRNLTIRVPATNTMVRTVEALGALPVEITYSELGNSLKSGNIDGAENGVSTYLDLGFYQDAPYYVEDAHTFGCGVILMNADAWHGLTEQQQQWFREAAKVAGRACYEHNLQEETTCYARFGELGVTSIPVEDLPAWEEACQPFYEEQPEEVQAMVRRIREWRETAD